MPFLTAVRVTPSRSRGVFDAFSNHRETFLLSAIVKETMARNDGVSPIARIHGQADL